jgi:hypothetical protein
VSTPRAPFFVKGDRVVRIGTSQEATVAADEEDGFVYVQYDLGPVSNLGTVATRPMLQFASKFRKVV